MSETLPEPVERYLHGKNLRDFDAAATSFLSTAMVRDEGRSYRGPAAIRAWMEETSTKYDDRAEVTSFVRHGASVEVVAQVSGRFPGSPAALRFRFTLEGNCIERLEIGS
jgi:hypothetical protein